jgi:hypothetical protein
LNRRKRRNSLRQQTFNKVPVIAQFFRNRKADRQHGPLGVIGAGWQVAH